MSQKLSLTDPIFRDRPLPEADHRHSLYLSRQAHSDLPEVVVRTLLVCCLLVSLVLGGWHLNAPAGQATSGNPAQARITPAPAEPVAVEATAVPPLPGKAVQS